MSLPYESNTTNWAGIRCTQAWIDYPFADDGDTTSKIYKMLCVCKNAEYEAPALSDVMSSAAVAKIIELPFAADATAYFVGDSGFEPSDGGLISFTRSFAPVPATRSRANGSYVYTFPAFRRWTDYDEVGNDAQALRNHNAYITGGASFKSTYELAPGDPDVLLYMPPLTILREPLTVQTYSKITYTFVYSTSQDTISADALWFPSHNDTGEPAVNLDFFGDMEGLPTGDNAYEEAAPYLCDDSFGLARSATQTSECTIDKTVPDLTTYEDDYIDTLYVNIDSRILPWMGNIYVKETISVLAK